MLRYKSSTDPLLITLFLFIVSVSVFFFIGPHPYYALVLPLFILTLFLVGRFPELGFYLVIALIPFYRIRGKLPWVIAGTVIILLFLKIIVEKKPLRIIKSNLWSFFLLFLAVNFFSALLSEYRKTSFLSVILLMVSYIYFTLGLLIINKDIFRNAIPKIIVISVGISTFLGILGKVLRIPFFLMQGANYERIVGGSGDPNNLSLMIIFSFPLLIYLFETAERKNSKLFYGLLMLIDIIGLILTYSRGGFIIFLLMLFMLFLANAKRFKPKLLGPFFLVLLFVMVAGILFVPHSFWKRQESISEGGGLSISRRRSYLTIGLTAFKKRPILGNGPRTFRDIFAESDYAIAFARNVTVEQYRRYAHNTYLEVLVGTGLIGMILYLAILWRTFKNFRTSIRRFSSINDSRMANLVRAYLFSYITIVLYLFIFSSLYQKYLWLSFALSEVSIRLSITPLEHEGE